LIKKIWRNNLKGFSLIELMVVVVILSLIVLGLVTFFTGGARSWISGQSQLTAQRSARQAMDYMVREIREGKSYTIGADYKSITISYPNTPDTFTKASVTYKLSGDNKLQREIDEGTNTLLNDVITLSFTPLDLSKIHILLEVDGDNDNNPDISLNTEVNLRNYNL